MSADSPFIERIEQRLTDIYEREANTLETKLVVDEGRCDEYSIQSIVEWMSHYPELQQHMPRMRALARRLRLRREAYGH